MYVSNDAILRKKPEGELTPILGAHTYAKVYMHEGELRVDFETLRQILDEDIVKFAQYFNIKATIKGKKLTLESAEKAAFNMDPRDDADGSSDEAEGSSAKFTAAYAITSSQKKGKGNIRKAPAQAETPRPRRSSRREKRNTSENSIDMEELVRLIIVKKIEPEIVLDLIRYGFLGLPYVLLKEDTDVTRKYMNMLDFWFILNKIHESFKKTKKKMSFNKEIKKLQKELNKDSLEGPDETEENKEDTETFECNQYNDDVVEYKGCYFFVEDRKLKRTVDVYNRGDDIHLDILVERKDNDDFDNLIPFWIIQFEYVISTNYPNFIYEKSIWRNKESSKGLYKKTIIESNYKTEQKRLKNLSHIALILRTSPEEPKNNTLFSDLRSLYDSKKQELEHQIYYKKKKRR